MRDFRKTVALLQAFRTKFERLLASARKKEARDRVARVRGPTRLRELTGFGVNPGDLRMFAYAPEHLPPPHDEYTIASRLVFGTCSKQLH